MRWTTECDCVCRPAVILDNYVLVNLFVAIICWGWESADTTDEAVFFTATVQGAKGTESFTHAVEAAFRQQLAAQCGVPEASVTLVTHRGASAQQYRLEAQVVPGNSMAMEHALATLCGSQGTAGLYHAAEASGMVFEGLSLIDVQTAIEVRIFSLAIVHPSLSIRPCPFARIRPSIRPTSPSVHPSVHGGRTRCRATSSLLRHASTRRTPRSTTTYARCEPSTSR